MSPRPRKASDDEVFAATQRVMMRVAPAQLTLAEIAREAGLTAGALVQRFGSKLGLMRALVDRFVGSTAEMFAALRAEQPSPLGTVYAWADCHAQMGSSPGMLAHHLAWLQLDLTDPEIHRRLGEQARETRSIVRGLLDEAVAAGELHGPTSRPLDTAALARIVEVTVSGSLMAWAFHQEGTAREAMWRDLDAVLGPYR
jgi:AcrR family transcriptional regulator